MSGELNRRSFMSACGAGCALFASGCVAEVYGGDGTFSLEAEEFSALGEVGGAAPINVESQAILLLRTSASEVVALSRICTHAQCDLDPGIAGEFNAAEGRLRCLCHGAIFDTSGNVMGGPAPSPLQRYVVEFDAATGEGRVLL